MRAAHVGGAAGVQAAPPAAPPPTAGGGDASTLPVEYQGHTFKHAHHVHHSHHHHAHHDHRPPPRPGMPLRPRPSPKGRAARRRRAGASHEDEHELLDLHDLGNWQMPNLQVGPWDIPAAQEHGVSAGLSHGGEPPPVGADGEPIRPPAEFRIPQRRPGRRPDPRLLQRSGLPGAEVLFAPQAAAGEKAPRIEDVRLAMARLLLHSAGNGDSKNGAGASRPAGLLLPAMRAALGHLRRAPVIDNRAPATLRDIKAVLMEASTPGPRGVPGPAAQSVYALLPLALLALSLPRTRSQEQAAEARLDHIMSGLLPST